VKPSKFFVLGFKISFVQIPGYLVLSMDHLPCGPPRIDWDMGVAKLAMDTAVKVLVDEGNMAGAVEAAKVHRDIPRNSRKTVVCQYNAIIAGNNNNGKKKKATDALSSASAGNNNDTAIIHHAMASVNNNSKKKKATNARPHHLLISHGCYHH